jgi:hypothetical protein
MTTYIKNLAEMLVNPDGGVQPRLPGRFEPLHPAGLGLFDFEPPDDRQSANFSEARPLKPRTPAEPPHPSGEQPAPAGPAPPPGERQPYQPEPASITSSIEMVSEPLASQGQLQRTATPGLGVEPVAPTVSREVTSTIPPTLETSAPETIEQLAPPAKVEPVSPLPQPDLTGAPTDSGQLSPATESRPSPVRSEACQPSRPHPPAAAPVIPVEVRLTPATETTAPSAPPAPPPTAPLAQRTTPPLAVPEEAQLQIEPDAKPFRTEPTPAPVAPEPLEEPVLVRAEERPPREPLFMEPIVPLLFQQEGPDQGPTIRGPDQRPTIRVTIGRIEVRAALPPAPPPGPQPGRRRPALPLDQYLKRRSEGKG